MHMKKYLIFLFTAGFLSTGCDNEEYFELDRPAQAPWQSLSDFEKAPIGAYYGLSGNGGSRTIFAHGFLAGELYADGVNLAPITAGFSTDGDAEAMYARQTGLQISVFDNAVFNSAYFAIGFANGAIDFIEENQGNPFPSDGRQDEIDRIKGELLFVRAYAYDWLVKVYMPPYPNEEKRTPFRITQAKDFDEAKTSELASTNDLYTQIIADLRAAKALLPERYDPALHPPSYADGRANKFAAATLLAKVLFQTGAYDEAETELNFVIDQNGGDYDLSEDPMEAFNKTGVERGKEVIWYYALWAGDGLGGSSNWKHPRRFEWYNASNQFANGPENNGDRFIYASDHFLQQVGWQDATRNMTAEAVADKRFTQLFLRLTPSASTDSIAPYLYPEPNGNFNTTRDYVWNNKYYRAGNRITNVPLLRLADMYLLRAILRARKGDTAGAISDLNVVRNRAGLGNYAGDAANLEAAIHAERFKEMALEGDRLFYLRGLQMNIPPGDRSGEPVPWDSPFYSEIPDYEKNVNTAYD